MSEPTPVELVIRTRHSLGTVAWPMIALLAAACDLKPPPAHIAIADPPRPSSAVPIAEPLAPVSTDDPRYLDAMDRGRAAFTAKDYAAAITAFEDACDLVPDEPRALSELGWSALHAGDLALAERVLVRATAIDTEPKLLAASLYNLGRVREAQARPIEAVPLYQRSLELRDSRTVRARLGRVQAAPAKATLDIEPLDGPFDDLQAWCADRAHTLGLPATFVQRCDTDLAPRRGLVLDQPPLQTTTGVLEARFIATDDDTTDLAYHHLAIRTDAGWFVRAVIATDGEAGTAHATLSRLAFEPIDLVPGGAVELMVRVDERWVDREPAAGMAHQDERQDRILCGLGRSGRPACTSPIPLVGALRELPAKGPGRSEQRWNMSMRVGKRAIVVTGDSTALDDAHRAWLGEHAIVFP